MTIIYSIFFSLIFFSIVALAVPKTQYKQTFAQCAGSVVATSVGFGLLISLFPSHFRAPVCLISAIFIISGVMRQRRHK